MNLSRRLEQLLKLGLAAAAGALLVIAWQLLVPFVGRALYQKDFEAAYIGCALAQQHAIHFDSVPMKPALRAELGKTLAVEQLQCLDYARLKWKLRSFHVGEGTIVSTELDALASQPELQCDARCIKLLQ